MILAIQALRHEMREGSFLITEVRIADNIAVLERIGGGQTLGIVSRHHVDHMLCVSALLPTLGATFSELMSFRDSELYLVPARPEAVGQPFGALVQRFPDCVLLGIKASFPLFEQAPSPLIINRRVM